MGSLRNSEKQLPGVYRRLRSEKSKRPCSSVVAGVVYQKIPSCLARQPRAPKLGLSKRPGFGPACKAIWSSLSSMNRIILSPWLGHKLWKSGRGVAGTNGRSCRVAFAVARVAEGDRRARQIISRSLPGNPLGHVFCPSRASSRQ